MFNTLMYAKKLEEAGVSRPQAEAYVQIMAEIVEGNLATKHDIQELSHGTKQDIQALRIATKQDIEELRNATKQDIEELRNATKQEFKDFESNVFHKFSNKMEQDLQDLRVEVRQIEYRIVLKLGAFLTALITVGLGVMGLLLQYHFR